MSAFRLLACKLRGHRVYWMDYSRRWWCHDCRDVVRAARR